MTASSITSTGKDASCVQAACKLRASCVQAELAAGAGHGLVTASSITSTGKDASCVQAGRGSNPRAHRLRPRFMVVSMYPGRGVRPECMYGYVCVCVCVCVQRQTPWDITGCYWRGTEKTVQIHMCTHNTLPESR